MAPIDVRSFLEDKEKLKAFVSTPMSAEPIAAADGLWGNAHSMSMEEIFKAAHPRGDEVYKKPKTNIVYMIMDTLVAFDSFKVFATHRECHLESSAENKGSRGKDDPEAAPEEITVYIIVKYRSKAHHERAKKYSMNCFGKTIHEKVEERVTVDYPNAPWIGGNIINLTTIDLFEDECKTAAAVFKGWAQICGAVLQPTMSLNSIITAIDGAQKVYIAARDKTSADDEVPEKDQTSEDAVVDEDTEAANAK